MANEPQPYSETQIRIANPIIRTMSRLNTWIYRLTNGWIGGKFMGGAPVLLLTVIGRKSGKKITQPLLYLKDGDRLAIVASKGGMPNHPLWYLNLQANPDVEVQIGGDLGAWRAHTASNAEKAALWPKLVAMYSDYDDYQKRTDRKIPVVILTRK